MINVGVIGTGFGAKIHIPGFRAVAGARVLGIAGRSPAEAASFAEKLKIPLAFPSWKALVDCPEINAVSIVSPPYLHKEMALYAARRRKHIFCEKPMAMSVKEAQVMAEEVRRARIVHMVDFEFRNIPGLRALAGILRRKTAGEIRHINIAWLSGGRASMDIPLGWQNDVKAGGGVLFSHAVHVIDYLELLFGKIKKVSAHLSIAKKNGATAEDTCDMIFRLANGSVANVSISNVLPNACGHIIEVYGDRGSLVLENRNLEDFVYGFRLYHHMLGAKRRREIPLAAPAGVRRYDDERLPLFIETAKEFIAAVGRGRGAKPSFADGLRIQRILDAVRSSSRLKKEIVV